MLGDVVEFLMFKKKIKKAAMAKILLPFKEYTELRMVINLCLTQKYNPWHGLHFCVEETYLEQTRFFKFTCNISSVLEVA